MNDYPDWTRLFHLVGTDITIPINIESSDITLEVNIATAVTLDVDITAASVGNLSVNLAAAAITLDVNLSAQSANIEISFADQSVAVFDAAKWFAHQAQEVYTYGYASCADATLTLLCSRVVPAGKTFFVTGMGIALVTVAKEPTSVFAQLNESANIRVIIGSFRGLGTIFDTPPRFTAGQIVRLYLEHFGAVSTLSGHGTFWGYDEDA